MCKLKLYAALPISYFQKLHLYVTRLTIDTDNWINNNTCEYKELFNLEGK